MANQIAKQHRIRAIAKLLAILLGLGALAWAWLTPLSSARRGGEHAAAIRIARAVVAAERAYAEKHGRFGDWDQLLADQELAALWEWSRRGCWYRLSIVVTPDGQGYEFRAEPKIASFGRLHFLATEFGDVYYERDRPANVASPVVAPSS